jgi:hypothetical protein
VWIEPAEKSLEADIENELKPLMQNIIVLEKMRTTIFERFKRRERRRQKALIRNHRNNFNFSV